jgi:hypothetical protein
VDPAGVAAAMAEALRACAPHLTLETATWDVAKRSAERGALAALVLDDSEHAATLRREGLLVPALLRDRRAPWSFDPAVRRVHPTTPAAESADAIDALAGLTERLHRSAAALARRMGAIHRLGGASHGTLEALALGHPREHLSSFFGICPRSAESRLERLRDAMGLHSVEAVYACMRVHEETLGDPPPSAYDHAAGATRQSGVIQLRR